MTFKPKSHTTMYEEVELLAKVEGAQQTKTVRRWAGRRHEQWTYRWVLHLLLKTGPNALRVYWCEVIVLGENTGKQVYHGPWLASHELAAGSVKAVVDAGRNRCKIENGGFNVLKNQGYNFEHNFGPGQPNLAAGHQGFNPDVYWSNCTISGFSNTEKRDRLKCLKQSRFLSHIMASGDTVPPTSYTWLESTDGVDCKR